MTQTQEAAILDAVVVSLYAAFTDYHGDMNDEKFRRRAYDAYLGHVTSALNSPPGIVFNHLRPRARALFSRIMLVLRKEDEPNGHNRSTISTT